MRKKWSYINDFKMTADGTYSYFGDWYALEDRSHYRKVYTIIGITVLGAVLLVFGSGLINAAGMNNTFYVILPYVGEICCAFALAWKTVRVLYEGEKLKEYTYTTAYEPLPLIATLLSVFSMLAFFGSVVFLSLHGFGGKTFLSVLYLVLKVVTASVSVFLRFYCDGRKWVKL